MSNRSRRRTVWLAAAGCVLVTVAACGTSTGTGGGTNSSQSSSQSNDSAGGNTTQGASTGGSGKTLNLTIGQALAMSGDLADFGPPLAKADKLAVQQIQAALKEIGSDSTVKLVSADTGSSPEIGVQAARTVVSKGASCIIGDIASSGTLAIARSVTIPGGILEISPSSTSDEITKLQSNGLINRTVVANMFEGRALAQIIKEKIGGPKGVTINVGSRNDAGNLSIAENFQNQWKEWGGTVGKFVTYNPGQNSYDAEAGALVEGNPAGWVIADFPETFSKFGPALARTGKWDPAKTFTSDALASPQLPDSAGKTVTNGMQGLTPGVPEGTDLSTEFSKLYQSEDPDIKMGSYVGNAFDATMLCFLSAVAAGSTNGTDMAKKIHAVSGPPGKKYTYLQLADAIKALQAGEDIDYEGVSGAVNLDEHGDPQAGTFDIYTFKDGTMSTVGQISYNPDAQGGGATG